MSKKTEHKDIKTTILILVIGLGLLIAGISGVVINRIGNKEYKASTDVRKISAVIVDYSARDSLDDHNNVEYTTYKFNVTYSVDGKRQKGKVEERVWARSFEKKYAYDKLRKGDTITVEVYKTSKGDYKLVPDGNGIDFLLYCAAIPIGLILAVITIKEVAGNDRKKKKKNEDEAISRQ